MNIFRCLYLIALGLILAPAFCQAQESQLDDLDSDSDGTVTKKEFKEYAKTRLQGFDQLEKFADRVDADKDGNVSEDEFEGRMEILQALMQEMADGNDKKKEMSKEDLKMVEEATKAFEATAKLVSKGEWEEAAKGMIEKARDDYAMSVVTQSLSLTKMKLPPQMQVPAINDAKDATADVIDEYKLGDIDISFFLSRPDPADSDDADDDDMTPEEKAKARQDKAKAMLVERKARQDKLTAEIMKALDADDQRWEIVAALRKAQEGSPFSRDPFAGKVSDSDIDDNAVFLTVSRKTPGGRVAIPTVVKMTEEKGKWKYAGMDQSRTQNATRKMMQRRGGNRAPAEPDTDF